MSDDKPKNRTLYLTDPQYEACCHTAVTQKTSFSKWASQTLVDHAIVRPGVIAGGICGFKEGACTNPDSWWWLKTWKIYACDSCRDACRAGAGALPDSLFENRRPARPTGVHRELLLQNLKNAVDALLKFEAAVSKQNAAGLAPLDGTAAEVASLFTTPSAVDPEDN